MKKHILLISVIAALSLAACATSGQSSKEDSKIDETSIVDEGSDISEVHDSSASTKSSSSEKSSSEKSSSEKTSSEVPISSSSSENPKPEGESNENFTLMGIDNLSSMSLNCKKYVDDMRAQQKKLIQEKGVNADYYINDLYGTNGVDLTYGVESGDNGGYRKGNVKNDYLDPVDAKWEDGEKSDESKGIEIEWKPADSLKGQEYTILYGMKEDLSDATEIKTNNTKYSIKNLLVNQKYYYKVKVGTAESPLANFTTGDYPRWIDARPMFNVRDAGGYMTSSGKRIKQGLVFRGGEITDKVGWTANSWSSYTGDVGGRYTDSNGKMVDQHITSQTEASKKVFRETMNMVGGLEIDLRSSTERNGYTACGFANSNDISYKLVSLNSYEKGLAQTDLVKQIFNDFANVDTKPVYYHCYGGADRTGTIGFLLGALLGMSYTDLVIDFELTSYSSNPSRNYRSHLRNGPYNRWPTMISELQNKFGFSSSKTIMAATENYLKSNCGVSQSTIDAIRAKMLED